MMDILNKEELQRIETKLLHSKKIVIISHYNPDGDAIGSSLSLYHFFKQKGYDVQVILPNAFPDFLKWMPGSDSILIAERHLKKAHALLKEADILFVVDMNSSHRSGPHLQTAIDESPAFKILIDHHLLPDLECDVQLSTTETSSTCELVYNFFVYVLGKKEEITKEIAECLYVGIITDTGSLSFSCNNWQTYNALGSLIKLGVDGEEIHRKIYDNYSEGRLRLLGLSLSSRLKVMPEYATSYIYLTKKDLKDFKYKIGDTEGFVNYGLAINSVRFTAFFVERNDKIRISFRSKGDFDVNMFARKHFQGGGHKNASASDYYDTLENTIAYFEEIVKLYQNELKSYFSE